MKIQSRDFGEVEIHSDDVITFVQPVFGFEHLSRYVFLFEQGNSHIVWLQSVEDPAVCFILADPAVVVKQYQPQLARSVAEALGEGEYMYWLVMVVASDFRQSTVNLKSPVVVNPLEKRAVQTILEQDLPIRCPLVGNGKERG